MKRDLEPFLQKDKKTDHIKLPWLTRHVNKCRNKTELYHMNACKHSDVVLRLQTIDKVTKFLDTALTYLLQVLPQAVLYSFLQIRILAGISRRDDNYKLPASYHVTTYYADKNSPVHHKEFLVYIILVLLILEYM